MVEKLKNGINRMISFTPIKRARFGRSKKIKNLKENIPTLRHQGGKKIKDGYGKVCARHCSCGKIHPLLPNGKMDTEKTMAIKKIK